MFDLTAENKSSPIKSIAQLLNELGNLDDAIRWDARQMLIARKRDAVPHLITALRSPNALTRREAARALGQIADPAAIPALISTLGDDENDVRWAAADSLILHHHQALVPLLQALIAHSDSTGLREGARHILRILGVRHSLDPVVKPVLKALNDVEPVLGVPIAAQQALSMFTTIK